MAYTHNPVGGAAPSAAVTVADGADVAQGATSDAAWSSGAGTIIALLKKIAGGAASDVTDRVGRLLGHVIIDAGTAEIGNVKNSGTFAVQAALNAETTKVIGTVNVAAGQVIQANAGTNLNTSALALEAGGNLAAIKADVDKIPSQGQALAAASTPVVLTAIQVAALTPPAAITGFALDSTVAKDATIVSSNTKLDTLHTDLGLQAKLTDTQPVSVASLPLPSGAATDATPLIAANDARRAAEITLLTQQMQFLSQMADEESYNSQRAGFEVR